MIWTGAKNLSEWPEERNAKTAVGERVENSMRGVGNKQKPKRAFGGWKEAIETGSRR
jgi:hypothetical protein